MNTAVILAAGQGTRCWPYNEVRNKCVLPVMHTPLVRRLADQVRACGFEQVRVVLGAGADSVRAAFPDCYSTISFVACPAMPGTNCAALAGTHADDEAWLFACGDVLIGDESVRALRQQFSEHRPVAAALYQSLGEEPPQDWICCEVSGDRITAIEGHSRDFRHRLCGLYIVSREARRFLETNPGVMRHVPVGGMPAPESELAEAVARMIDAGIEVLAVPVSPPPQAPEIDPLFVDVDKPWHILEANRKLYRYLAAGVQSDQIPATATVSERSDLRGRVVMEPGSVIGDRAVIEGTVFLGRGAAITNGAIVRGGSVGANAVVRDYAQVGEAVIGNRCVVGHGAEFSGVMMDGAYLYHYCEIFGVVGESVDIGAATVCGTLRFDDLSTTHRVKGRREVPRTGANATYFGDYSRTGVNAITMPGVKIGTYSVVGPGVVLYHDLPSRKMVSLKQDVEVRDWGPERYGW